MEAWYLLCYQPGKGSLYRAQLSLDSKGVNVFCPMLKTFKEKKDGTIRMSIEPLFNGYLFVCFDPETIHPSRIEEECPGVSRFVRCGDEIRELPGYVIDTLMDLPFCSDETEQYRSQAKPARPQRPPRKNRRCVKHPSPAQRGFVENIKNIVSESDAPQRTAMFLALTKGIDDSHKQLNRQVQATAARRKIPTYASWSKTA